MTCREKLAKEHPDCVGKSYYIGGCHGCPHDYGYLVKPDYCNAYNGDCNACWDREIPDTNSNECITTTNEKEKNMATTKKTKAELMEELENAKKAKEELEKELKNLEKYKQYEDAAGEIYAFHTSFVMAGFSEEQAFELVKTMIANAGQINFNVTAKPNYRDYYKR